VIRGKTSVGSARTVVNVVLANAILLSTALAQSEVRVPNSPTDGTHEPSVSAARSRYRSNRLPRRATMYYAGYWGVDSLNVKWAESGEIIRFTYHVLDADKAKPLNDKKAEPLLIDPQAGVKLVVPVMEKVGQLRQSSTPEAGKSYWMAFSNSGRRVKRGDHVNVVIGQFHANGLVVE
jgi:hypothetical protein